MLMSWVISFLLTPIKLVLRENQQMKFYGKSMSVSSFVTVLVLFAASFMGIAPVGAADHGQLVEESPRRDVPVVLDGEVRAHAQICLLYTSPSPRDQRGSRMPSSA